MEKPKVEIAESSDPLDARVEELAVAVTEDIVHAACPYCRKIKCQRLGSIRRSAGMDNSPSNILQLKCLSCGNAFSTGY